MNKTIEEWRGLNPSQSAGTMSEGDILWLLSDARHDILKLHDETARLRAAIQRTLDENGHLADGPVCTLHILKEAIGVE